MRIRLSIFIALIFINFVNGQTRKLNLIVGTFISSSNSDGIFVYGFDPQSGNFNYTSKFAIENPLYIAISQDGKNVCSVNTVRIGGISAFAFNSNSGDLTFLNRVNSGGNNPSYIVIDDENKFVFVSNYGSGSLIAVSFLIDGSLSTNFQLNKQPWSSIDKNRQTRSHVHSAVLSPDNRYLLTPNLGTD